MLQYSFHFGHQWPLSEESTEMRVKRCVRFNAQLNFSLKTFWLVHPTDGSLYEFLGFESVYLILWHSVSSFSTSGLPNPHLELPVAPLSWPRRKAQPQVQSSREVRITSSPGPQIWGLHCNNLVLPCFLRFLVPNEFQGAATPGINLWVPVFVHSDCYNKIP